MNIPGSEKGRLQGKCFVIFSLPPKSIRCIKTILKDNFVQLYVSAVSLVPVKSLTGKRLITIERVWQIPEVSGSLITVLEVCCPTNTAEIKPDSSALTPVACCRGSDPKQ